MAITVKVKKPLGDVLLDPSAVPPGPSSANSPANSDTKGLPFGVKISTPTNMPGIVALGRVVVDVDIDFHRAEGVFVHPLDVEVEVFEVELGQLAFELLRG